MKILIMFDGENAVIDSFNDKEKEFIRSFLSFNFSTKPSYTEDVEGTTVWFEDVGRFVIVKSKGQIKTPVSIEFTEKFDAPLVGYRPSSEWISRINKLVDGVIKMAVNDSDIEKPNAEANADTERGGDDGI